MIELITRRSEAEASLAIMLAYVLAPIASLNAVLLSTPVHASLFPYPLLSTLHAARISLVHRALSQKAWQATSEDVRRSRGRPTWAYDIVGFLVMCWGGSILNNVMLTSTPPFLLSIHPFLNYVSVHLLLSAILSLFPNLTPPMYLVDTVLPVLDGCLRTQAVVVSLDMVRRSPNESVRGSLLIQLLAGVVGSTGGGQLAGTLGMLNPAGWTLSTPPFFTARSILPIIDIYAALVATAAYGLSTGNHAAFSPLLAHLQTGTGKSGPILSAAGGRALATLVFAVAFAYRALMLHWIETPSSAPKIAQASKTHAVISEKQTNGKPKASSRAKSAVAA